MSTYVTPSGAYKCYIESAKVYADSTFALVPFDGSSLPSGFWNGIDPTSGTDFFFSDMSGVVASHDVIHFDHANSGLLCWIKLPEVSQTVDTEFLIQWGSGNIIDSGEDAYKNLYGGTHNCRLALNFQHSIDGSTSYFQSSEYDNSTNQSYPQVPTYVSGIFGSGMICGRSLNMPDSDDYSFVADSTDQPFTLISLYNKIEDNTTLVTKGNYEYSFRTMKHNVPSANKYHIGIGYDDGSADPDMITATTTGTFSTGWQQAIATYDGSATFSGVSIYVDGISQTLKNNTNNTHTSMVNTGSSLSVAQHQTAQSTPNWAPAYVDYLIIMEGALSSGEVRTFYEFLDISGVTSVQISGVTDVVEPVTYLPTITSHPTAVSKNVGDQNTFTVVASGATSYQWQKDGTNIAGATSSTYFDSYVYTDDSGTYRVATINEWGTTYSNGALLTVLGGGAGDAVSGIYGGSQYFVSGYLEAALVAANDINVPVPMGGSGMPSEFWDNVYRSDGKDIVVTNLSGVPFRREIVHFDPASQELVMWVRFPTISATVDTRFLIQYGSSELNYAEVNVFDGNYTGDFNHRLACHFRESPNDSSSSGHIFYGITSDAIPVPSPLQYNDLGQIDKSLEMNYTPAGTLTNAYTPDAADFSFLTSSGDAPFTIRTWMRPRSGNNFDWDDLPIIQKGATTDQGEWYYGFTGTKHSIFLHDSHPSGTIWAWYGTESDGAYTGDEDTWKHLACTYDGEKTLPGLTLYENGAVDASTDTSGNVGGTDYSGMENGYGQVAIGVLTESGAAGYSYSYAQDVLYGELFILNGELTADQMTTQHQLESTFNDQATIVYGDQEEFDTDPYVPPVASGVPTITTELVNIVRDIGDSATWTVSATGGGTLSYSWTYDDSTIVGASSPSYTLDPVLETSGGTYEVTVASIYGTATSSATLSVVGSSGIIPTGVLPADPDDYVFIDKDYTGFTAIDATNIYNMDIGNLFYGDEKTDRFLFGNLQTDTTTYILSVSGVNTTVWENLTMSTNRSDYSGTLNVSLEYNEIVPIYLKYDVEDNPDIGHGTLLIAVGEA